MAHKARFSFKVVHSTENVFHKKIWWFKMRLFHLHKQNQFLLNGTPLILAAGAAIALLAFSKGKAAYSLNYFVEGLSAKFDGATPVIQLRLGVQNPSGEGFTVKSIVGNLFSGGYLIGNVSAFTQTKIRPLSTAVIPVNVRLSLVGIAIDLFNLLKNKNGQAHEISFKGYVNVNNVTLPLTVQYKVF